jgi:hypothetical protein
VVIARGLLAVALTLLGSGCGDSAPPVLEGRPAGPYRLTLETRPATPQPGVETDFTLTLTRRQTGAPVTDLQVVHERPLHTFIVARDFSSFAHLHQEDFGARSPADEAAGRFSFPWVFPRAGQYRLVAEFTHRERAFSQTFDLAIGAPPAAVQDTPPPPAVPVLEVRNENYTARLRHSPARLEAGREAELVLNLAREGLSVTDLGLLLGAEVHAAIWREDGQAFGHTHSYTPAMARMMKDMAAHPGQHSAAMMLALMTQPATLVYPGPEVPLRHTFPSPGTYHLFLQCAPGGLPEVFHFVVRVEPATGDAQPLVSIVPEA